MRKRRITPCRACQCARPEAVSEHAAARPRRAESVSSFHSAVPLHLLHRGPATQGGDRERPSLRGGTRQRACRVLARRPHGCTGDARSLRRRRVWHWGGEAARCCLLRRPPPSPRPPPTPSPLFSAAPPYSRPPPPPSAPGPPLPPQSRPVLRRQSHLGEVRRQNICGAAAAARCRRGHHRRRARPRRRNADTAALLAASKGPAALVEGGFVGGGWGGCTKKASCWLRRRSAQTASVARRRRPPPMKRLSQTDSTPPRTRRRRPSVRWRRRSHVVEPVRPRCHCGTAAAGRSTTRQATAKSRAKKTATGAPPPTRLCGPPNGTGWLPRVTQNELDKAPTMQ